ncbi:MAG: hypothetical protein ACI9K1_001467, partial [Arcticibacterium sp.]
TPVNQENLLEEAGKGVLRFQFIWVKKPTEW